MPLIQPEEALMVEKDELALTCAEYWIDPLEMAEGFQVRVIPQDEDAQVPSATGFSTGVVGVVERVCVVMVKLPTVDQAEIFVVATESRAWTLQYQVPLASVGV